ncbi:glycosyl hydrolase [Dactylosporangium sp. AC04546]|uniref:glycoside hydrolase family 26 protein n=1 Tax=Dactylosporangium sp. AC04546 TaxID=2862460 RepID=UPI001EDF4940|nr:glycosyl hydrolase [Dactylosporangium sp. AC04546]WVK86231.1 glycosyl hydrolase [Dactylosporangium sp. AC04546]
MITLPRIMFLALLVIGGYVFVVAPRVESSPVATWQSQVAEPTPTFTPSPKAKDPEQFPPVGKAFFGIFTDRGPGDLTDYNGFVQAAGRGPQVMMFAQGWATHKKFDRQPFDRIVNRGMLPMLGWEPWNYRVESKVDTERGTQPEYRLAKITGGAYDAYIKSYAEGIKALGYPVALRFAHEMNGYWYPWCESANGNKRGDYVAAWKHVHDLFDAAGARNVIWVWSPNVVYENSTPLSQLYPGDDYVDWVGLSGYYGTVGMETYQTFEQIYRNTLSELKQVSKRPIVVTEVAATDAAGRKAEWITDLLKTLPKHPEIIGFMWYESVKETDWRISVSKTASAAFAQGVAQPYFSVTWSPDTVPRRTLPAVAASASPSASRSASPTPSASRSR